jgi:hypothetical protein
MRAEVEAYFRKTGNATGVCSSGRVKIGVGLPENGAVPIAQDLKFSDPELTRINSRTASVNSGRLLKTLRRIRLRVISPNHIKPSLIPAVKCGRWHQLYLTLSPLSTCPTISGLNKNMLMSCALATSAIAVPGWVANIVLLPWRAPLQICFWLGTDNLFDELSVFLRIVQRNWCHRPSHWIKWRTWLGLMTNPS